MPGIIVITYMFSLNLRLQFHHTPKGDPWSYDFACYIIFGANANGQRCSGKVSSDT